MSVKKKRKTESKTRVPMEETKVESRSLLSMFMTTPAASHIPRKTTGEVVIHKEGPVMTVQRDETLPRVFRKLSTEGFLSAPVLDGRRYTGVVSMLDLVKYTTNLFWGDTKEEWSNFWEKEERFQKATIDDVLMLPYTFNRDPFPPVQPNFTTFYALELMARTGMHRIVVVDPKTKHVTGILTQSMIISWIRQNMEALGELRTKKISEMLDNSKPVQTINGKTKTINAFNKMVDAKVSGLAVVDDEGVLTGAISVRDLRGVGTSGEYFYRLFHAIRDFKKEVRLDYPTQAPKTHYSRKMVPLKGLYVCPDDSISDLIRTMNDGNIHRVFVCSTDSVLKKKPVPTHVITQTDILKLVLDHIILMAGKERE